MSAARLTPIPEPPWGLIWLGKASLAYFVSDSGFTFEFWSVAQIEMALRFYRDKVHPGSRMPTWGEHDVTQRWYERVPLYLQENGKREKVIKALERAIREFGRDA